MATGDIVRLTLVGEQHGQKVENVTHWRMKSPSGTETGLRTTVADAMILALKALQSNEFKWVEVVTRGLVPANDQVVRSLGAGVAGTVVQNALPTIAAVVTNLRTGLPGRSYRGRLYLPGVPVTSESNSQVEAAALAAAQAAFDALLGTYGVTGSDPDYQWGVFSRVLGGSKDPYSAAGFRTITGAAVRDFISSFTSRKYGRGM